MAAAVVIALSLAGLGLAGLLVRQEPARGVRLAAVVGGAAAFLAALGFALAAGKSTPAALAIALLGGAVLSLALLGQMRLVRAATRPLLKAGKGMNHGGTEDTEKEKGSIAG